MPSLSYKLKVKVITKTVKRAMMMVNRYTDLLLRRWREFVDTSV